MTSPRNKFLILIITVLVISNLALAGYLIFGRSYKHKPPRSGRDAFSEYMKKELNFSEEQAEKFKQLTSEHFEKMRPILQDIRQAKDSFFSLMRLPEMPSDSLLMASAEKIAAKQKYQELQSFRHFRQVRALCNDEQKLKFDTLIKKMINRSFSRGPDKGQKEIEKQKQ
jgi:protein CpxP